MVLQLNDPFVPSEWLADSGITSWKDVAGLVVGPLDSVCLVSHRDKLRKAGYKFGDPVPSDVFIFSVGEAPRRDQTKIGGMPYLDRSDSWPTDSSGKALPFVGQMNFQDSTDILKQKLPGDLLLIFGDVPSRERSPEVVLLWKSLSAASDTELVNLEDLPCKAAFDTFYGTRWRTENFPDAYTNPENRSFTASTEYYAIGASEIFATQISNAPFLLSRNRQSMTRSVVCCFAPVKPVSDGPFPFGNVSTPLLEIRDLFDYRYSNQYQFVPRWRTWGDATSLYILQNEDGSFSHEFIIG
ncbi:MAG: DUF1963 domain-containing protein [Planctomycetaceae bacterium]